MEDKILKIMEFPVILKQLQQQAVTEGGKNKILKLVPQTTTEAVQLALDGTEDGMTLLRLKGGIPIPKLNDLQVELKRVRIGASLNGLEIAQIGRVLRTASELKRFFEEVSEDEIELNVLMNWIDFLQPVPELSGKIRQSVSESGEVQDEASTELRQIRFQIRQKEQRIREQLDEMTRGKNVKYLSNPVVTMRNERYVLPVKQEYRHLFGGVVHDQSSSGQTVFVEPKKVVDLNNQLRQLQVAESQEVLRILAELTALIFPHVDEIEQSLVAIAELDVVNAKAKLAKDMKAIVPKISEDGQLKFIQARHPLIDQTKVVANDIYIGDEFKTLVITGPNTGGKTLILKTIGLLSLMGQSGLAIPANEESQLVVYQHIMADIGDEQSIEQNLSTFSGHMKNIVSILQQTNANSLVLFDELGAGTDPQEGAALAIAILDAVAALGADVIATTHYPELKMYGYNRPQTMNASMEFDVETLGPTYHLLIGIPGRSNAFEIAKRLGLNNQIIDTAKQLITQENTDLNDMITDLEATRQQMNQEYQQAIDYVNESESLYHDLKHAYQAFNKEKQVLLNQARKQANNLVDEAEQKADAIIQDLKEREKTLATQAIKEHELISARSELKALHQQEEQLKKNKVLQKAKRQKEFHPGDEVMVETYGQRGTLIRKEGNEWEVQLGILKMKLPEDELTLLAPEKQATQSMTTVARTSSKSVSTSLDLRGKRYDEAMAEVERYLDQALLAGYASVTLVHGKGTGALRQGIQNLLKQYRSVQKFEYAPSNAGGDGATIVYFK